MNWIKAKRVFACPYCGSQEVYASVLVDDEFRYAEVDEDGLRIYHCEACAHTDTELTPLEIDIEPQEEEE